MKNIEEKRYWIWFSLIPNLNIRIKKRLLEIYKNPKNIFYANKLKQIEYLGDNIIKKIQDSKKEEKIEAYIKIMKKENVDIVSIYDKDYPQLLKNIYDFPISLFIKGNKENLNRRSVAIIGCRSASEYGKEAAKYFGYNLSKNGINIVSDLERGVERYSLVGSICAKKEENNQHVDNLSTYSNPIVVTNCILDSSYIKENKDLEKEILNVGGTIISECLLEMKLNKYNFFARNRIISGLSDGVVVVEAKKKSRELIIVDFALEQGREVFVIPRKYKFCEFSWYKLFDKTRSKISYLL